MRSRTLTDEQEALLAADYRSGATMLSLSDKYECSEGTVKNVLRRQKVALRSRKEVSTSARALTAEQEASLIQDYLRGEGLEKLAVKYPCSAGTARNVLLRHKVKPRRAGKQPRQGVLAKVCVSCQTPQPIAHFYREGRRDSECKRCIVEKQKQRYHLDPTVRAEKLEDARRRRTGWSSGEFEEMWRNQKGLCAICSTPMKKKGRSRDCVHADHDHATGRTRSLLCGGCNIGLGAFRDTPEFLLLAADYLRRHRR